jgi:ferric-dicitrate binding protein FerR (iron transport regulator)
MEEKFPIGEHLVDHLLEGTAVQADPVLDEWRQANSENQRDLEKYRQLWEGTAGVAHLQKFDTSEAWKKVDTKLDNRNVRTRQLKNLSLVVSGMVASLLIFLSLNFFTSLFSTSEASLSLLTTYGSRSEVVLPDGSVVKLNAGSSLEYHYDKLQKTRKVNFSGEAFFDVAKSRQPFVIQTVDGLNLNVLGTKFNLSAYPEDHLIQTSLVEGKLAMSYSGSDGLVLSPDQIVSFNKESKNLEYSKGVVTQNLGWIQDKLYMENMSLQDVCTKLERWYDVQIVLIDNEMGENIHYTGVLKEQTVLDVLNALCQLSSIQYELKGKNIVISRR